MELPETEKAYIAGFFDGEGWIGINKRASVTKGKTYPAYSLMVGAGQCDIRPLLYIKERFGGGISTGRTSKNIFFTWVIYSKVAEGFLRCIAPYLIHKRGQCEVALAYRDVVNGRKKGNHLKVDAEFHDLIKRVRAETREESK